MEIPDGTPDNTVRISMTFPHRSGTSHSSRIRCSRARLPHDSPLLPLRSQGNSLPPSVSSNSMNSLVVEGVIFSNAKSNRSSLAPGLPRCVLQAGIAIPSRLLPTTAAATIIAHPSDARGRLYVSRPLHAQLEHEQHLLSRCTHSP